MTLIPAADNPIGLSDHLGLRPITDAEINAIRERQIAVADVLNAGIYLVEGNYGEAALPWRPPYRASATSQRAPGWPGRPP